jgi:LmbE family N-acetylglucosaminyl deacetylase
MKLINSLLFGFALFALFACKTVEDVTPYAATETYPEDTQLSTLTTKKAMVIVAHDDDMCLTSGTISRLNKQGWEIRVLSLPQADERNAAHLKACRNILDSVIFFDLSEGKYRFDLDTTQYAYRAISTDKYDEIFNRELLEKQIIEKVNEFNPSVIFSLDNEVGGYGHPDHVMVSQLVYDLAQSKKIQPQFIYQSVYTNHMQESIMKRHSEQMKSWGFPGDMWEFAKKTYKVDRIPEPTVQINIEDQAKEKMAYLNSYNERERKTIGHFVPAFMEYDAETYFGIFNREFYRVISFE